MVLGAASNGREVIIRLMPVVDDSAPKAFKELGKQVQDAYKKTEKAAADSNKAIVDAEKTAYKERMGLIKQNYKEVDKALKDRIKQEQSAANAKKKIIDDEMALEEKFARAQEKAAEKASAAKSKAADRAATDFVRANKKMEVANARVIRGLEGSIQGALGLAKNIALLGLVGEKDTQKIINGLIKIQAGFSIVSEGINLVMGLSRAWKAVEAAAAAAATKQIAAMALSNMASGGGGLAGNVASGIGGGAAVLGGKAVAAKSGLGMLGTAGILGLAATGPIAIGLSLGLVGGEVAKRDRFGKRIFGIAGGAEPGGIVETIGAAPWNPMSWAVAGSQKMAAARSEAKTNRWAARGADYQRWREIEEGKAGIEGQFAIRRAERENALYNLRASARAPKTTEEALNFAREDVNRARERMGGAKEELEAANKKGMESGAIAAEEKYRAEVEQTISVTQREREINKQLNQERIGGLRETMNEMSALAQQRRDEQKQLMEQSKSIESKLADMGEMGRQQIKADVALVKANPTKAPQESVERIRALSGGARIPWLEKAEEARRNMPEVQGLAKEIGFNAPKEDALAAGKEAFRLAKDVREKQLHEWPKLLKDAIEQDKKLSENIDKLAKVLDEHYKRTEKIDIPKLIDEMISRALERHAERQAAQKKASGGN
jgi:hypothetical protein